MNQRWVILWGLGAAQLLVAVIAFVLLELVESEWIRVPCVAILLAQPYLTGVWITSGRRSLPWRLTAVAVFLVSLTWVSTASLHSLRSTVIILSRGVVASLGIMLLFGSFGLRLRSNTASNLGRSKKFQFSLQDALEWTTVSAILCSLSALVAPELVESHLSRGAAFEFLLFHIPFAGMCIAELAIILDMRRPWFGLVLLSSAGLAVAAVLDWRFGQVSDIVPIVAILTVWLAICFVPLRLLGYRFGRCHSSDTQPAVTSGESKESA